MVNRQRLVRTRDLTEVLRVTVFSPDDLALVKGGPAERRRFLDDLLSSLSVKDDRLRADVDRILRQRNTLLRQVGGRLDADAAFTLDVWDAKLAEAGDALGQARSALVAAMEPYIAKAYAAVAGGGAVARVSYEPSWLPGGLAAALDAGRRDDVRRGVSLVGPHRDELGLDLVATRTGEPPLLLLDDVFSELDPERCQALLGHLPDGQVVLTTAGSLPAGAHPQRLVRVVAGAFS